MNIVICDDVGRRAEQWRNQIRAVGAPTSSFAIKVLEASEFSKAIQTLLRRQLAARSSKEVQTACVFDDADLLVVDFDLLRFAASGTDTGESVAYFARCYSDCGYIIEVNQFGTNWFDLTLSGRLESYADLNLGSDQLANPGLWSRSVGGFRPWSWPVIPDAVRRLRKRSSDAWVHRASAILAHLGLTEDRVGILPRSVREFLTPRANPEETTFEEFVRESRYGLRQADRPRNEKQIGRIAAARVAKWLEEAVLAGQEVLVDAPHLVARLPSLLKSPLSLKSLNATAQLDDSPAKLGISESAIASARFNKAGWLSRPAWRWFEVARNEEIDENKSPWSKVEVPFGFCEDVSMFLPTEACREFVAEVDSAFNRRFVANFRVEAGRRMAARYRSKPGRVNPRDPIRVKYEPADRLAV
jgi:hypothetical protein